MRMDELMNILLKIEKKVTYCEEKIRRYEEDCAEWVKKYAEKGQKKVMRNIEPQKDTANLNVLDNMSSQEIKDERMFEISENDMGMVIRLCSWSKSIVIPSLITRIFQMGPELYIDLFYHDIVIPISCVRSNEASVRKHGINDIRKALYCSFTQKFFTCISDCNKNIFFYLMEKFGRTKEIRIVSKSFAIDRYNYTFYTLEVPYSVGQGESSGKGACEIAPLNQSMPSLYIDAPALMWSNSLVSIIRCGYNSSAYSPNEASDLGLSKMIGFFKENKTVFIYQDPGDGFFVDGSMENDIKFVAAFFEIRQYLSGMIGFKKSTNEKDVSPFIDVILETSYKCCYYLDHSYHVVIEDSKGIRVSVLFGSLTKILFDPYCCTFDGFFGILYTDWLNNCLFYQDVEINVSMMYLFLISIRFLQYKFVDSFEFTPSLIDYMIKHLWSGEFFPFCSDPRAGSIFKRCEMFKEKFIFPFPHVVAPLYKQINFTLIPSSKLSDSVMQFNNIYKCQNTFPNLIPLFPMIDKYLGKDNNLNKKFTLFADEFHFDPDVFCNY